MEVSNKTRVQVPALTPSSVSIVKDISLTNEGDGLNPNIAGRLSSDNRHRGGLLRPSKTQFLSQLNCRSLTALSAKEELKHHLSLYSTNIATIQEHRQMHKPGDHEVVPHSFGLYTLFTVSAYKNLVNSTIGGVGLVVKTTLLPLLVDIHKVSERILLAVFKGNPKTYILSCYSPTESQTKEQEECTVNFYNDLKRVTSTIPPHAFLLISGDFNAHIVDKFSYHSEHNTNGLYLHEFMAEYNLFATNTTFQKPKSKLWTHRSPNGHLSQIDYILCRKRWRNSIHDSQAHSSSDPIGSDHRVVTVKCKLSLRSTRQVPKKNLNWKAITKDDDLAKRVESQICDKWESVDEENQSYTKFVEICNKAGEELLPSKKKSSISTPLSVLPSVAMAREEVLQSTSNDIQRTQTSLKVTYEVEDDTRINDILLQYENKPGSNSSSAWELIRKLSGKKSSPIFIRDENRLEAWKSHFEKLLNVDNSNTAPTNPIQQVFKPNLEIRVGHFCMAELNSALKQMKNEKAPGLDCLPVEVWKLPRIKKSLLQFCNLTYSGNRPDEWGISGIVPVPKKGNLTIKDNYRGISLTQSAAKIYNRLLLNRIRPEVDKVLRSNQNGFRELRSTASMILALRRIIEEVRNHQKEAVIVFIDFKKAFDSVNRSRMFDILLAYGIPEETVNAIKIMYENTSATVLTPEGETEYFSINSGILQGDPLAPFLFIIVLDYALRMAIEVNDGLVISRRRSSRHPAQHLADLDFADDIALLENTSLDAEHLLHKVEKAALEVGLALNASKTKFIHVNRTNQQEIHTVDGNAIEQVDDFLYLGSYTDTTADILRRKGLAWSAINSLDRIWRSKIHNTTKIRIFKMAIESVLLYSCESWSLTKSLEKSLDGTYTRMLRRVQNISWRDHVSNCTLYGKLKPISSIIRQRRLKLAGHVSRHNEPATQVLLWEPDDARRKVGRPRKTLKSVIEDDVGVQGRELKDLMLNRDVWRNVIMSH